MQARICIVIQQLDARNRNTHLDGHDDRVARGLDRRKGAGAACDLLRNSLQPQRHGGENSKRALGADEKPGQVIARRGFARPARGADFLAVGGDGRDRQHIVLHRAVANGIGSGSPRRRHAADRGIRTGIDRKEETGIAEIDIQLFARNARLDGAVEIFGVYFKNPVHPAEIDRNPAIRRIHLPLQRRARAEADDRHLVLRADLDGRLHVIGGLGKQHAVRQLRGNVGGRMRMLGAEGFSGLEALAEALL